MRERIAAHLRTHDVARIIYGAIIGLALILALEAHPPGAGATVAALLGTAFAVALAEIYSDIVGTEVSTGGRISRERYDEVLAGAAAAAFGVGFPAVFFVLAAAGALELDTAFTIAKWSGMSLIGFYGFCAARLAGATLRRALLHGLAVGLIGTFIVALKALTH